MIATLVSLIYLFLAHFITVCSWRICLSFSKVYIGKYATWNTSMRWISHECDVANTTVQF
jgi:hypothetical protein